MQYLKTFSYTYEIFEEWFYLYDSLCQRWIDSYVSKIKPRVHTPVTTLLQKYPGSQQLMHLGNYVFTPTFNASHFNIDTHTNASVCHFTAVRDLTCAPAVHEETPSTVSYSISLAGHSEHWECSAVSRGLVDCSWHSVKMKAVVIVVAAVACLFGGTMADDTVSLILVSERTTFSDTDFFVSKL